MVETEPRWPEPPRIPEPPKRTEPLHIPTVIAEPSPRCADRDAHYACETVDALDAELWEGVLRSRYGAGYRLAQVVPGEHGRALLLFEHEHERG